MADNKFQTPEALARCLPMSRLQAVLSGKWKILILWYVAFYRVQRFGALLRRLDGITQSTLTRQLRELEADGFLYTVAGKGCFVAEKNLDLIREQKLKELEEKAAAGTMSAAELENQKKAMELVEKYEAAMEDDFNTADAVSAVFELVKLSNSTASAESTGAYVGWMKETIERLCGVLGIITEKKEEILDSEIEDMIAQRQAARKAKDFALADQIRGKLLDMGIILEDTREGVKWKRA